MVYHQVKRLAWDASEKQYESMVSMIVDGQQCAVKRLPCKSEVLPVHARGRTRPSRGKLNLSVSVDVRLPGRLLACVVRLG